MLHSLPAVLFGLPLLAYLLGSIPWGLVLTRWFTAIDIRQHGSGNIGATNVRRLAGMPLGLLTLTGDVLKGAVPVYLAGGVMGLDPVLHQIFVSITAAAAFGGHLFPLYLKMKGGGKGVATAFGCFVVISPLATALALALFLLVVWLSRRVSAGSLSAAAVLAPAVWWSVRSPIYCACALLIALMIFIRHKENVRRLLNGSEPEIGQGPHAG
jgi:glycerol-3-phosphate acyltransferase PlsY